MGEPHPRPTTYSTLPGKATGLNEWLPHLKATSTIYNKLHNCARLHDFLPHSSL